MSGQRDLHNNCKFSTVIEPALAVTIDTLSAIIDTQGFGAHEFVVSIFELTNDVDIEIQHGEASNGSDFTVANVNDVLGGGDIDPESPADAVVNVAAAGTAKIGYVGSKRYIAVNVISNTATFDIAATVDQGYAEVAPVV